MLRQTKVIVADLSVQSHLRGEMLRIIIIKVTGDFLTETSSSTLKILARVFHSSHAELSDVINQCWLAAES